MTYSIIGILASIILLIINRDVIWGSNAAGDGEVRRNYRFFLFGVMAYYITDMLWGILHAERLIGLVYADTVIHFIAMAAAVMLWTRYVISYLGEQNTFSRFLYFAGRMFLVAEVVLVAVNFFKPVIFWFDESGEYHAESARYVTLAIQITLFFLTSIYTLYNTSKTQGTIKHRHMTIGVFGIAMVICIGVQVFYPLLPFYAMGYMLGTCLLHSFVLEDEKEEYRTKLEEALEREHRQKEELQENREALRDALASAENASKAKTTFLSNMSHEIRTPMNAIIGLNNIAMNEPSASDKVKEYLKKIDSSAQHLLGIINDILDMSRIESGRLKITNEKFSFARCIEQINTMIGGQCAEKGIIYDSSIKGRVDDYYYGDAMKLKQVLINILGNAVKFTPEGGTVTFVIEEGPEYDKKAVLGFKISDTGIGMSSEYLPHIFDAFSQEDSSATNRYGSTGLGMPITKSIVELMNGTIDVESEKGKGTTFTVTVTLGKTERSNIETPKGELDPHELNVLVIDDDKIAREHAEIVLGEVGVKCDTAGSGKEGLEMVKIRHGRNEDYNLILVDWRMPDMDGMETSRQIRATVGDETPIIILTSFNWDEIESDARKAGVDTFVSKPLFAASVIEEFREAFRRKNEALIKNTVDLAGKHILLAEDVPVNAEIMMMLLSMRDMEVDLAENGRIAVDLFEKSEPDHYDAILMDMRMPEMDGLEATRVIRKMDRDDASRVPIIALTANAFDEDVQRSMQAGLNAHLSKPVEPEVLYKTLEKLIAGYSHV